MSGYGMMIGVDIPSFLDDVYAEVGRLALIQNKASTYMQQPNCRVVQRRQETYARKFSSDKC